MTIVLSSSTNAPSEPQVAPESYPVRIHDGSRIAIGVPGEINGINTGHTLVFDWSGSEWVATGEPILGEDEAEGAGSGLAFSADGERIAVGSPANADGGRSGGGDPAGQIRVYDLVGGVWTQVGDDILGGVALNGDNLGSSVALSADGARLLTSGPSNSVVRAFDLIDGAWTQLGDDFPAAARSGTVALSADGRTAAAGFENSLQVMTYRLD